MQILLKLALLIISFESQNRFNVFSLGFGYVGIPEKQGFTISELSLAEFQDYKLIQDAGPVSFGLLLGGAKLFPSILVDRTDETRRFITELRYVPGGGLLPASLMVYSKRLIFTVVESKDTKVDIMPFFKIQIIPISDALVLTIFNPALFTKRLGTPPPYPHFEISSGAKGVSGSIVLDLKFGIRTYSFFVPELTQAEKNAIEGYKKTGSKPIIGKLYDLSDAKYGFLFFFNFLIGFDVPGYYVTKVVTVEEKKMSETVSISEELEKKIKELEAKLAELEKQREEERKRLEEELSRQRAAQEKAEGERTVARVEEKKEIENKPLATSLGSEVLRVESYKDGKLNLSWSVPQNLPISNVSIERCLGYNCENFSPLSSFSASVTTYQDSIIENQIYCYRLSVKVKRVEKVKEDIKEKVEETINSGKICTYVSFKGEVIRVYF